MIFDEHRLIDLGISPILPRKKVLLVDDELSLQGIVDDILADTYQMSYACDGEDALRKAAAVKPDVILMDIMMPKLGGYEAMKALAADEHLRAIPVLFVTAREFDRSTVRDMCREPNVAGFLEKPFLPQTLRNAVWRAINGERNIGGPA